MLSMGSAAAGNAEKRPVDSSSISDLIEADNRFNSRLFLGLLTAGGGFRLERPRLTCVAERDDHIFSNRQIPEFSLARYVSSGSYCL